ncbi:MAG: ABC transporter permease subunit [Chloroflexi bacterium]|nr:ABC transporter permease subunit [Chloroflexota bacterium]MDA1270807.1 ABC transporter permease subunit [Chloroflexota bacterium]
MLRSVFGISLYAQRWPVLAWGLGLGLFGALEVAIYPSFGDSTVLTDVLAELPEGFVALVGGQIDFGSAEGWLNIELFGLIVPIMMIVYGATRGASMLAGEEERGLLDFMLANPIARERVLVEKAAALLVGFAAIGLFLWAGVAIGTLIVDVDIDLGNVALATLSGSLLGFVFGSGALLASALTGRPAPAAAIMAALGLVAYLINAFYTMVWWLEPLRYLSPIYYYNSTQPLVNGLDAAHVGVLASVGVAFVVSAAVIFRRKDLGVGAISLLSRIPNFPAGVAGSWSLRSVLGISLSTQRLGVLAWGLGIGAFGFIMIAIYPTYSSLESLKEVMEGLPEGVRALFGGYDLESAGAFLSGELFGFLIPIILLIYGVTQGSAIIAGEERRGLLDFVLANPLSRARLVLEKWAAMLIGFATIGALAWLGIALGTAFVGVDLDLGKEGLAAVNAAVLGTLFGSAALFAGAATGRPGQAAAIVAGLGLAAYFLNAFYPIIGWLEPFRFATPLYYYGANEPLLHGLNGWHVAVLASLTAGLVAAAVWRFQRRDLSV